VSGFSFDAEHAKSKKVKDNKPHNNRKLFSVGYLFIDLILIIKRNAYVNESLIKVES